MMLAVALLDLPFKAGVHEEKLDGIHYTIQTASPVLVFHRRLSKPAAARKRVASSSPSTSSAPTTAPARKTTRRSTGS